MAMSGSGAGDRGVDRVATGGRWRRWGSRLLAALLAVCGVWCFGAVYFDGPWPGTGNLVLALVWATVFLGAWLRPPARLLGGRGRRFGRRWPALALLLVVMAPWAMIQPSNERDWQPEFGRTGHGEVGDDGTVTLHEVRNFEWKSRDEAVERWETRSFRLDKLRGVDLVFDAFMGDVLAHPMLSFDFGEDGRVVLSAETRREVGESFSALGGFYKMFELQYLFGDERDFIRLRTNIRRQPVYLYRLRGDLGMWREFFLTTVDEMNQLREEPAFYNVITHNCTTSLYALLPAEDRGRWDWRVLVNGRLDELLWRRGVLASGQTWSDFDSFRELSRINQRAQEADDAPDFSERIRHGVPGFHGASGVEP